MINVSAIIIFHGEQTLAQPALLSFFSVVDYAKKNGLSVETVAVIDKPDDFTLELVSDFKDNFDKFEIVDFGDLGESRNYGQSVTTGEFITFFDGDDLWGDEWILRSFKLANTLDVKKSIFHPEIIYYFTKDDYGRQSPDDIPRDPVGFYFVEVDSRAIDFDPNAIILNNLWTANSFAHRSVYENHPYKRVERKLGYGVEDWLWNAETLSLGFDHIIVEDTIHCVRLKSGGSLSSRNMAENLLPPLHECAVKLAEI